MYTKAVTALTLLSSAFFASALPAASAPMVPRSCQVSYPNSIGFPINYAISQDAGAVNKVDDTVSFNIPAGSYGCSLVANFPSGYPITSSGNSQVYVYDSNNNQVGTVTFVSPMSATINSFACQPVMTYRLSIGSASDAGSVAFADTLAAGLTMTYNC